VNEITVVMIMTLTSEDANIAALKKSAINLPGLIYLW